MARNRGGHSRGASSLAAVTWCRVLGVAVRGPLTVGNGKPAPTQQRSPCILAEISDDVAVVNYAVDTSGETYFGRLVALGPSEAFYSQPAPPYKSLCQ
jgi:hypothetical protein